jgi:4-amino-4-deoxy-L-arabinose transferase-like glycosyltransferase
VKPHLAFNEKEIARSTAIKGFLALLVTALLLRIVYAGHLFEDDGLWFTAAEEILRGKALYSEIYFDKPPLLPLLYALLFKLFGAHILTIRLFAAAYSVAVAFVLYRFGTLLYDRRNGWLAALLFVVGSTTYTTGQFQGFNTDSLMTLPYTFAAYLFVRSRLADPFAKARRAWLTFASGLALGLALQSNPKALFDLLFFVLCALFLISGQGAEGRNRRTLNPAQRMLAKLLTAVRGLLLTLCGCLVSALPFWIYIAATRSWNDYWFSVWSWGARYANYYSWEAFFTTALRQSFSYFALNNLFLVGLLYVSVTTIKAIREKPLRGAQTAMVAGCVSQKVFQSDAILLLWFIASYAGMSVGGRFFGHYFLQILPSLCLLTGRGLTGLFAARHSSGKEKTPWRRVIFVLLAMGVLFTLARYHTRTISLAMDWARGTKGEMTRVWFYERQQREDRYAAATVKEVEESPEEIERLGLEALRHRPPQDAYLFVWGYRPEIYYWAGLLPASRYLSSQLLTGVPADVNYFGDDFTAILDDKVTAAHRARLLQDLRQTRPQYIIDELAAYNSLLAMENYPELKEFLSDYKLLETEARGFIYGLRRPKDKKKNLAPSSQ